MAHDVGTLKLCDYRIQVGNSGIIFLASLSGFVNPDNSVVFEPIQIEWAYHRAASQIAFMGLIRGDIFAFMRTSVPMSVDDAATLVGYAPMDVMAWEDGAEPVPTSAWEALADYCCTLDHRPATHAMNGSPDFRARTIRIVPNVPMISVPEVPGPPPCPSV
jgi:hypothetical protein